MTLKEDLIALMSNPASRIEKPEFDIEESPNGKIAGFLISRTFAGMPQIDRQDMVWNYLDKNLDREKTLQIISLVTVTPEEIEDD